MGTCARFQEPCSRKESYVVEAQKPHRYGKSCFIERLLYASRMFMSFACTALPAMNKQMDKFLD